MILQPPLRGTPKLSATIISREFPWSHIPVNYIKIVPTQTHEPHYWERPRTTTVLQSKSQKFHLSSWNQKERGNTYLRILHMLDHNCSLLREDWEFLTFSTGSTSIISDFKTPHKWCNPLTQTARMTRRWQFLQILIKLLFLLTPATQKFAKTRVWTVRPETAEGFTRLWTQSVLLSSVSELQGKKKTFCSHICCRLCSWLTRPNKNCMRAFDQKCQLCPNLQFWGTRGLNEGVHVHTRKHTFPTRPQFFILLIYNEWSTKWVQSCGRLLTFLAENYGYHLEACLP